METLFDPVLLRSFTAILETGSFTGAAQKLGLSQSTISQHLARLEARTGKLIARSTHGLAATPQGDAILPFARQALAANARIGQYLADRAGLRGRVRFGASEDFVFSALPEMLADFTARHEGVELELSVALSEMLYERFESGQLDLILAKRREGDARGRRAWVDEMRWAARPGFLPTPGAPLPLVLYPPPSMTRRRALAVLDANRLPWRIGCTSASLSGLRAAAIAGLGLVPLAGQLIPPGLAEVAPCGLPTLGPVEFVLVGGEPGRGAIAALAQTLLAGSQRLRGS